MTKSDEKRRRIVHLCENLKEDDYIQIYKIIKQFSPDTKTTKNMNGYFINLSDVSDICIKEIENYLSLVQKIKQSEEEFKKKLCSISKNNENKKPDNVIFEYEREYDPYFKSMNDNQKAAIQRENFIDK